MAEYELVHEIKNQCPNNQMRDIFFEEVECDDPESFLRARLKGTDIRMERENGPQGVVTVHAVVDGLVQKFVFTPI